MRAVLGASRRRVKPMLSQLDLVADPATRPARPWLASDEGIARGIFPEPGCCRTGAVDVLVKKSQFRRAPHGGRAVSPVPPGRWSRRPPLRKGFTRWHRIHQAGRRRGGLVRTPAAAGSRSLDLGGSGARWRGVDRPLGPDRRHQASPARAQPQHGPRVSSTPPSTAVCGPASTAAHRRRRPSSTPSTMT